MTEVEQDVVATLLNREAERCKAVMAADVQTLDTLTASDLVHVHVTARVNDKAEYLEGIRSRSEYKSVTRDGLKVRVYGDVAVMTGLLTNVHRLRATGGDWMTTKAFVTQVWSRADGTWRQVLFQATRLTEA